MAEEGEEVEKLALRKELKWLLGDEVHYSLDSIEHTLKECCKCFPMRIHGHSGESESSCEVPGQENTQYPAKRMLLSSATSTSPGTMKCMLTLKSDSILEADIMFKHKEKGKDNQNYRTAIMQEKVWKIQQIQDAANHLEEALEIIAERQQDYKFKSAQEVLMLLEKLKKSVKACRHCLSTPKRKSLHDLVHSKTREIFSPPVPQNVALSFYIHGSKIILAIYLLHMNGQQKMDVSQRLQMEAAVPWLNEAVALFTLALQQCQQLADKVTTLCQCGGWDTKMNIT